MAERTGKGVSLKHGLIALIGVCWVLPVLLILTLSGYFIRNNLQSRIDDTIETSVTNAMNMTKAFTTPWSRVMVTMSPFPMCDTSCASTASSSFRFMERRMPVDTATRLRFFEGPVAKAFTSGDS